jgi:hypothetical protein
MTSSPKQHAPQEHTSTPLSQRLARAIRRCWAVSTRLFTTPPTVSASSRSVQGETRPTGLEKRRHPRIPLHNTTVHVTDGCLSATARIDNISPSGICLCNLPEQLYRSTNRLTVFSKDNPGLPVLHIQPCWQTTGWGGKTIGAAILNATDAWRLFFVHAASRQEA